MNYFKQLAHDRNELRIVEFEDELKSLNRYFRRKVDKRTKVYKNNIDRRILVRDFLRCLKQTNLMYRVG